MAFSVKSWDDKVVISLEKILRCSWLCPCRRLAYLPLHETHLYAFLACSTTLTILDASSFFPKGHYAAWVHTALLVS